MESNYEQSQSKTFTMGNFPLDIKNEVLSLCDGETLMNMEMFEDFQSIVKDPYKLKGLVNSAFQRYFEYDMSWYDGKEYSYDLLKTLIIIGENKKNLYGEALSFLETAVNEYQKKYETYIEVLKKLLSEKAAQGKDKILSTPPNIYKLIDTCFFQLTDNLSAVLLLLYSKLYNDLSKDPTASNEDKLKYGLLAQNYSRLCIFLHRLENPKLKVSKSNLVSVIFYSNKCSLDPNIMLTEESFNNFYSNILHFAMSYAVSKEFVNALSWHKNKKEGEIHQFLLNFYKNGNINDANRGTLLLHVLNRLLPFLFRTVDLTNTEFHAAISTFDVIKNYIYRSKIRSNNLFLLETFVNLACFEPEIKLETAAEPNTYTIIPMQAFNQYLTQDQTLRGQYDQLLKRIYDENALPQLKMFFLKNLLFNKNLSLYETGQSELNFWLDKVNYGILKRLSPQTILLLTGNILKIFSHESCKIFITDLTKNYLLNLIESKINDLNLDNFINFPKNLALYMKVFSPKILFEKLTQCQKLLEVLTMPGLEKNMETVIEFSKCTQALLGFLPTAKTVCLFADLPKKERDTVIEFLSEQFQGKNITDNMQRIIDDLLPSLISNVLQGDFKTSHDIINNIFASQNDNSNDNTVSQSKAEQSDDEDEDKEDDNESAITLTMNWS